MLKKKIAALLAAVMTITCLNAPVYAADSSLYGDADLSGTVTSNDAALVLEYTLDSSNAKFANFPKTLADVNADGIISADDAAIILQHVLTNIKLPYTGVESTETTTETTTVTVTETTTETTTVTTTVTETTTETTTAESSTETTTSAYYDFRADTLTLEQNVVMSSNLTDGAYTILPSYKLGAKEVTVDGETYSQYIQLYGTGSTSTMCFYFDAPCGGKLDIIARSSNAANVRNAVVADSTGKVVATFTMPVSGDTPIVNTAVLSSGGRYYIYGGQGNINVYRITYTGTGDIVTESTTQTTTIETTETTTETTTFSGDTSDGVVVNNFSDLKTELAKKNNKIYILGTIECSENIKLSTSNANVEIFGLTNADGTAATLDFAKLRDSRTSSGSGGTGFTISGSYYTFKNVIIQNAGDCGTRITGSHNNFENCVFRYNNNSGVSVTKGGAYNTFRYVDSYRNGDLVQKNGADADGFSVKLAAGMDNNFYNCRAWENSDDGWDSYDRSSEGGIIGDIRYEECVTWNNGNPYVFTGEYDYEHGYALDKNLLYVQAILAEYPDFETDYNNHTVTSWPQVTVKLLGTSNTYSNIHSTKWAGNPNGFKFGSAETPSTSYRYIKNCIAFGHENTPNQTPAKGFDQNNGYAQYDIVNALSFDNGQNYWMDRMSAKSMTGVFYSFNSGQSDAPGDLNLTTPDTAKEAALRKEVEEKTAYILEMVYSDKIPGEVIYNVFD